MPTKRNRRRASAAAIAGLGLLVGGIATATASPAEAASSVSGTVSTGGLVLNVRKAAKTDSARIGTLQEGTKVSIVCQEKGTRVNGTVRGTDLWDRLADGGYVSDAYIKRPATALPVCPLPKPSPSRTTERPASPAWVLPVAAAMNSAFRTPQRPTHNGMDLAAAKETPVKAAHSGTVMRVLCQVSIGTCDTDGGLTVSGCGWLVEIRDEAGIVSRYCHLVRRPVVVPGQKVTAGDLVGQVGSSGHSTGPHLHFEIHTAFPATPQNAVDPFLFLKEKGVPVR
ncbi:peptidoglycan DD-metalloendopeptidase family protein [Catenuloplanes atrovinosus]|uniref:Murein DD-endopeptidase MepM/ murein hydrolase activator NlpD n=1 Tax=Catenuloplanes atrovinosus TaxID=137266 RepID=A0AAE3YY11_9ACTN|nr:peptidoglycan DD-metalloendopeptidase family protein [Catenuloplanes atrovinosus]MDR7280503.1 murein DD-endopeptidase MepM/ murein hydrolase activator NlpD [Catenuloplanes atrovinosus]